MADLDTMVLGLATPDPDGFGHHHSQWQPKQHSTKLKPQRRAQLARKYTNDDLWGHNKGLACLDFGQHANIENIPPTRMAPEEGEVLTAR